MKAMEVIARDHAAIKEMFGTYTAAPPEERKDMAKMLFEALTRHEAMEDMHFYPALKKVAGDDSEIRRILDEQTKLKMEVLGKGMAELFTDDEEARIRTMMEDVLAHATEEEQVIFPKAEALLDEDRLVEIGEKMEPMSVVEKVG
jgi:hemerythrin superfamily protein